MPYITKDGREKLDKQIDALVKALKSFGETNICGALNYTITRLMMGVIGTITYSKVNNFYGMLGCCREEFYRRVAAPYEDKKMAENGDVKEYSELK